MVIGPENATGWSQIMDGHMISAVYTMYDTSLVGWTIAILFFVYQIMLFLKTRNLVLSWITGILFASLYATSIFMKPISLQIMFIMLALELAIILFVLIWK